MGGVAVGGRVTAPTSVRNAVGVIGGTFDPVHLGHLALAEEAREALALERILFVPAAEPPHKRDREVTRAAHRVAMVELAIADNAAFELSRAELERPGPSFTVDTLTQLGADGGGPTAPALTLLLSAETFRELPTWREPQRILRLARVAVAPREGYPMPGRGWLEEQFPGLADRVEFLDSPHLRVSASEIRARVAAGRSIRYLVPPAVDAYIRDNELYRAPAERRATSGLDPGIMEDIVTRTTAS